MSQTPQPRCPRCGRAIAAWRLDHCVYCGAAFPPDVKPHEPPPEARQWIERPALPPDAARQLELLRVVPMDQPRRSRSPLALVSFLSIPVFAGIFYLLYRLLSRYSAPLSGFVLVAGAAFLLYLGYAALRSGAR